MSQLIISTTNATLEVTSLHPEVSTENMNINLNNFEKTKKIKLIEKNKKPTFK